MVGDELLLLSTTALPGPLLELGLLGLEASKPADRIAASSSFREGSCTGPGVMVFLGEVGLPQSAAADLTEGELSPAFSLLSSTSRSEGVCLLEPKPLKSATSLVAGVGLTTGA